MKIEILNIEGKSFIMVWNLWQHIECPWFKAGIANDDGWVVRDCLGPASPIIKPNHCRFSENNPDHVMWFWWQTILMVMMKFKVDTRWVLHMTEMGGLKLRLLILPYQRNHSKSDDIPNNYVGHDYYYGSGDVNISSSQLKRSWYVSGGIWVSLTNWGSEP